MSGDINSEKAAIRTQEAVNTSEENTDEEDTSDDPKKSIFTWKTVEDEPDTTPKEKPQEQR